MPCSFVVVVKSTPEPLKVIVTPETGPLASLTLPLIVWRRSVPEKLTVVLLFSRTVCGDVVKL
jgi:hypothetical protein